MRAFIVIAILVTATAARAADDLSLRAFAVINEKCLTCHGKDEKELKGGLDLRVRATVLKGGESGPALVPGNADESLVYIAVTRREEEFSMPPKENDKLSPQQVELIHEWINAGAHWPDATAPRPTTQWAGEGASDGVIVATSGGLSPDWDNRKYVREDLWAYQPIQRPDPPRASNNPIDAFIQHKLDKNGITHPAPLADKLTIIRRLTFDLHGLPPTPDAVAAFVNDDSPDAYTKLVDRLLSSPHYGEQMARHWIDVARYADTGGFSNDFERPSAWRYRDYVIRSFNSDKPYDRFIVEQLAGDELDANDPEMLIAAGFVRMGPWEHTEMTVAAVTRQQFLDDITQSVGVTFLAQPLRCASCHDHKFDPIPTRDYYRIQAVFSSTQLAERAAPFLSSENIDNASDAKAAIQARLEEATTQHNALQRKNQAAIAAYLKEKGVTKWDDVPADARRNKGEFGLTNEEISIRKINRKRMDYFERELERYEPLAYSVYSGASNDYSSTKPKRAKQINTDAAAAVPAVHILTGGSLESPGQAVTPGVLSAVYTTKEHAVPDTATGRRLALARWIASSSNTLAPRVIVNRVWQMHFGKGLVATPNNFGKMGGKPTHPELLDYLASWFIDNGWSLKKLHELIVTSETYRQSGQHPQMTQLAEIDSKNDLLAWFPPRRLAAEEIRDAMLAVSGELNPEMGGPGVFPEINWEVAFQPRHIMGSVAPAYQPSRTPAERNRRTIYAFRYRTLPDPMLEVFNRPGSETSCERRDATTVTPQAFALFNSEFSQQRALAMAASLRKQSTSIDDQVAAAFHRVYGRAATDDELKECASHVEAMRAHHQNQRIEPRLLPDKIARHMVEEMTGQDVHWDEPLDAFRNYQRDLMPWDADAETRALAELCLVLMNSNEFLYVR